MNTRNTTRMLCTWLLLSCFTAGAHAVTVTIPVDGQQQRASLLCWAATSAMAVNSFHIPGGEVTQAQLAALAERGIQTRAQYKALSPLTKSWVDSRVGQCDADISLCDERRLPLLPGLTFKTGDEGKALKWADLRQQIDDKRPVIFTWVYLKTRAMDEFEHQFIILGYREEGGAKQVLVWDPMPVRNPLKVVPHASIKANLKRWIPYDTYRNPRVHAGRKARHGYTTFNLALEASQVSLPLPVLTDSLRNVPLDAAVDFRDALREADTTLQGIENELRSGATPRHLGRPMPLIALEDGDIVEERDPASLLHASTSTLLVPVESAAGVDDAFLLIRVDGTWQRAGYMEFEVARTLLAQRDLSVREQHLAPEDFFAVSMPQRATFFAAYGYREAAKLIPIATDPRIGAYAGQPRAANEQLESIGRRILRVPLEHGQQ